MEIIRGQAVELQQFFLLLLLRAFLSGQELDPGALRHLLERLTERNALHLAIESNDVAALTATKALENLELRRNHKGRCFFGVERANGFVVLARFLNWKIGGNNFNNVEFLFFFFFFFFSLLYIYFFFILFIF